jgi:hypothetical protein
VDSSTAVHADYSSDFARVPRGFGRAKTASSAIFNRSAS